MALIYGSINSKRAHPPAFVGHFSLLLPHSGAFAKEVSPGVGHCQKQLVFRNLKVAYGSTPTCTNIYTIVSTCEQEITKRRTYMAHGKVAVLGVKKQFELLLFSRSTGWLFTLFQKPHSGPFVCVSWPYRGAFSTIVK